MISDLKILLVDDDKIMLFLHEMFLKKSGILHDTVLCYNGLDALQYLDNYASEETHFLVLLDINMPVMNGWEFLNTIADRPYVNRVHVVMVSSATEESEKKKALNYSQVIDYQQKPLNVESCGKIVHSEMLKGFFEDFTAE
ncbi:response regulator [Dyadobacter fanqingshengii]|uniref:Response regulator n=1 Tax=Dyadobacter fanqingshengii TaxID=2906443 RepID=A0A9X1PF19_9BACT|nr:response regulator [Dyadobacter fanqingshengii]MCF0042688.1 response regulator [Dyadobacter fanqingshengii]MCF2504541.1 response regulator [Dyadobacter fanqingshengii]USJ36088.1 response regulator [Dyadobacter fanqingshengii]